MRQTLDKQPTAKGVRFLYYNPFGRLFLRLLTWRPLSRIAGKYLDSKLSRRKIKKYIKKHDIDMSNFIQEDYASFNAFFTRRIKPELRPFDRSPASFVAPCDGKLTLYEIDDETKFEVKGFEYTVETLLKNRELASRYRGGFCFIFRLAVEDYHRYFYLDDGIKGENVFIKGRLHTVQPAALEKKRVFTENCREYTVLETEHFGAVTQVEVGAMMVGRIVNLHGEHSFKRGEEKGRFEFGGSTIIVLVEKGKVVPDAELGENTAAGKETIVKCGERIGVGIDE
ncbi:MAG: phosphatidylserine decarboxylase [Clostridia bacterium]|nr:phosphatidylserine decarboxylase [Clostridia bacterium]